MSSLLLPDDYQDEKLNDYRLKRLKPGLGIGCDLDNFIRYKQGQFNLLMGVDNVGKTFFKAWYYTALAVKHGLTFCIYSTENEVWSLKMKILSFYTGKHLTKLDETEYLKAKTWMEGHFQFIDDTGHYTIKELLDGFRDIQAHCFLIDPHNSLRIPTGDVYSYHKESLGWCRQFTKQTQKTLEINGHCVTEASRRIHKDGLYKELIMPPEKSHWDGGQIFPNRCDDFLIIHRYFKDPWKSVTLVNVDKVKETETGGERTSHGEPVMLDFKEYGFYVNGVNPITDDFHVPDRLTDMIKMDGGMENFKNEEPPIQDNIPF